MPQTVYRAVGCSDSSDATPRRPQKILLYDRAEWDRVQSHLTSDARKMAAVQAETDKRLGMKKMSKKMQSMWSNTIDNVRDAQLKARAERLEERERATEARYLEMQQSNAEERKKYLEECRKLVAFQKDDVKKLNSALVFTEVLRERDAQLVFDKKLKELDVKREEGYVTRMKKNVAEFEEEERQKKVEKQKTMMKYRETLIDQIGEIDEAKMKETKEDTDMEKMEIKEMLKEIEMGARLEKEDLEKKRAKVRDNVLESLEAGEKFKRERRLEEEEEDKAIAIYASTKQRIDWRRKDVEHERMEKMRLRQEKIAGILGEAKDIRDAVENASIKKALEELEAKEELRLKQQAEHRRALREDSMKTYHDFLDSEARKKLVDKHLVEWETMQRLKLDEMNREFGDKETRKLEETIAKTKANYDAQIAEEKAAREKVAVEEAKAVAAARAAVAAEHGEYLEYAEGMLEESKQKGRMLLPIQKVVLEYKLNNNLMQKEKNRRLHQSQVPCCEVRKWPKPATSTSIVK